MLKILSLGAGVQSSTLARMAAAGEIEPLDAAIFADTQAEPAAVYRHLDALIRELPFPVHCVTAGSLRADIVGGVRGDNKLGATAPFFVGNGGMLRRQCTQEYKVVPIMRKVRELAGIAKRSRGPKEVVVELILGISVDEASRMRDANFRWIRNRYPLVERGITRADCLRWNAERGFSTPPRSACTFCPYHDTAFWRAMKRDDSESFADAVRVDEAIRPGISGPKRPPGSAGQWYVHASRQPLAEVDFSTAEERGQRSLFENECTGLCGV